MKAFLTLFTACLASLISLNAADAPSLQTPQHIGQPKPEHAVTDRAFTGIPFAGETLLIGKWTVPLFVP